MTSLEQNRNRMQRREMAFQSATERNYKSLYLLILRLLKTFLKQPRTPRQLSIFIEKIRREIQRFTANAEKPIQSAILQASKQGAIDAAAMLEDATAIQKKPNLDIREFIEKSSETIERDTADFIEKATVGATVALITLKLRRIFYPDDRPRLANRLRSIHRTESFTAYRASVLETFKEADVRRWKWIARPDACPFCKEQNGKVFDVSQKMETHPNCRCVSLPTNEQGDI